MLISRCQSGREMSKEVQASVASAFAQSLGSHTAGIENASINIKVPAAQVPFYLVYKQEGRSL